MGKLRTFLTVVVFPVMCLLLVSVSAYAQVGRPNVGDSGGRRGGDRLTVTFPVFETAHAEINIDVRGATVTTDGSRRVALEGDLPAVAVSTARGILYRRDADLMLSDNLSSTSFVRPATGDKWRFDFRIDDFQEFHLRDGSKIVAVDVHLEIFDNEGRRVHTRSYYDPPKNERFTEQQLLEAVQNGLTGIEMVEGMVRGLFGDGLGGLIIESERRKMVERFENYKRFEGIEIANYQRQEALIREAVSNLLQHAPLPGQPETKQVRYDLKKPRRGGAEFERGNDLYDRGLYQDAVAAWSSLPDDDPHGAYNIGVAHLAHALETLDVSRLELPNVLPEALEALERADEYFQVALSRHRREMDLLNLPIELRRHLENAAPAIAKARNQAATIAAAGPPPKPTDKHALLIGIGKFADSRLEPLAGTGRDVRLLRNALVAANFPESNITTLVDEEATQVGIRKALDNLSRRAGPDSLVVISISTHGSPPDTSYDTSAEGYLLCHDSHLNSLFATAYAVLDFREHIDRRIHAVQKIVIQDTCHAGYGQQRRRGQHIEFVQWPPYMAVLASCDTTEESYEIDEGGLFTLALASHIRENAGRTTIEEIASHLRTTVPERARSIGGVQTPQVFKGPGAAHISLN